MCFTDLISFDLNKTEIKMPQLKYEGRKVYKKLLSHKVKSYTYQKARNLLCLSRTMSIIEIMIHEAINKIFIDYYY